MSNFTVIENNNKARDEFGHNYGSEIYEISKKDIQALLNGKQLASEMNAGEYSIFIRLEDK